jgi:predicted glycoside hydrolase/deacetylase ChbG (UPF0249 family)
MIPANLIINADDFGLDERVSRAIDLCLDEGLINSFSVFPFWDEFHGALLKGILAKHPQVKVGAHLALVGSAKEEHKDHYKDFLKRYLTGKISAANVKSIWRSQIQELGEHLGGTDKIAHLDSHQHLHVLPGLWQATVELQEEFGIPRVRVPYESLVRAVGYRFPFGLGMQVLARLRVKKGTPGFVGFFTSTCFTLEENQRALEKVRRGAGRVLELMVHPAMPEVGAAPNAEAAVLAPTQKLEMGELRKLRSEFTRWGKSPGTG